VEPLMAYFCRCYAIQIGIEEMNKNPSTEAQTYLIGLMDLLEKEKENFSDLLETIIDKGEYVLTFALNAFKEADEEDRQGKTTKSTATSYYHASIFIDVYRQFGELDEETLKIQDYSRKKAAVINKNLRSGEGNGQIDDENEDKIEKSMNESKVNGSINEESMQIDNDGNKVEGGETTEVPSFQNDKMNQDNKVPSFSPPPRNPYQNFPEVPSFNNDDENEENTQRSQPPQQPRQNQQNIKQPNFGQPPQYPLNNQKNNQNNQQKNNQNRNNQQKNTQSQNNQQQKYTQKKQGYSTNEYVPQQTYGSYSTPIDNIYDSQKYAKYVLNSLQFEDVPAAIENLYTCLKLLTGVDYKSLRNQS